MNGLTILIWFIGMIVIYGVAYLHGKADEKNKRDKEVKVLNDHFRSIDARYDELKQERQHI